MSQRPMPIAGGVLRDALDANSKKITNLAEPTASNDAATKNYVDTHGGGVTLDDTVTQSSPNGVKSSGIWSFVKGLLPNWLTSSYAEPATVSSVSAKADKAVPAAANNFAALDSSGNLVDSTKKAADFAAASHTHAQSDVTGLGDALAAKLDKYGSGGTVDWGTRTGTPSVDVLSINSHVSIQDNEFLFVESGVNGIVDSMGDAIIPNAISAHNAANDAHADIRTTVGAKVASLSCGSGASQQTITPVNGVADVSPLFTSANTSNRYQMETVGDGTSESPVALTDRAVNVWTVNTSATDLYFALPVMVSGRARDLIIALDLTDSAITTAPTLHITGSWLVDGSAFPTLTTGKVNLLLLSEMMTGRMTAVVKALAKV